jgi:hypothetical protein
MEHYHRERNDQGLGNHLIVPLAARAIGDGRVLSRERIGGLLKYYHRPAPRDNGPFAHRHHPSRDRHSTSSIVSAARSDVVAIRGFQIIDG